MRMLDIEQGTQEWLELRRRCIGASDSPIIMRVSPWRTPYQLWREKIFGETQPENIHMARGKQWEDEARNKFNELMSTNFKPCVGQLEDFPWLIASFDGMDESGCTCEIKCPSSYAHNLAKQGNIPGYYMPQLQHQMMVSGAKETYYVSYRHGDIAYLKVEKNEEYIATMMKELKKFYECMVNLDTPELIDRDYVDRNDVEFVSAILQWHEAEKALYDAKNVEELARESVLMMMSDQNTKCGPVKIKKVTRKGPIHYSKIKELEGIDLDKYRSPPITYWKMENEHIW